MAYRYLFAAPVLALAACASGPSYPLGSTVHGPATKRALDPVGEPGSVAAADLAYAKAVREEGANAALGRFADSGALLHVAGGPADAARQLAGDPQSAQVLRGPRRVWSSCDGSLAVSTGRFQRADGLVGNYTTVWELQSDGEYEWTYELREIDDPQPPPPPPNTAPDEDTIVVQELVSIEGRVADCGSAGARPAATSAGSTASGGGQSRDGMLAWTWSQEADGTRRVAVGWMREGEWQVAHEYDARP